MTTKTVKEILEDISDQNKCAICKEEKEDCECSWADILDYLDSMEREE
jgi:hypothetical protein